MTNDALQQSRERKSAFEDESWSFFSKWHILKGFNGSQNKFWSLLSEIFYAYYAVLIVRIDWGPQTSA